MDIPSPDGTFSRPNNRLRETALGERPQERFEKVGAAALSDAELLALILRKGTRGHDVLTLANRLISDADSLAGLAGWCEADLRRHRGIGHVKAIQLMAVIEIARRVVAHQTGEAPILANGSMIAAHIRPQILGLDVEKLWVLCLNRKNRLIKRIEVSSGTATSALAHPREIYRAAIRESATAIACVHNHPSGDPSPSAADLQITRLLREAAQTVEIALLDHVIVGRLEADPVGRGYYSFREAGLI
jgi:DNA repair protein RadC